MTHMGKWLDIPAFPKSDSTLNKRRGRLLINGYTLMSRIDLETRAAVGEFSSFPSGGPAYLNVQDVRRERGKKKQADSAVSHGSHHPVWAFVPTACISSRVYVRRYHSCSPVCFMAVVNIAYVCWRDANMTADKNSSLKKKKKNRAVGESTESLWRRCCVRKL